MNKTTKVELRQVAKELGALGGPAKLKPLAKHLDLLISRAWDEGAAEKAKVQNRLEEVRRLDEGEIKRQVKEQADRIRDEFQMQCDDLFSTRCGACEAEYEEQLVACRKEAQKYAKWFHEHCEGVEGNKKKIRVLLFGTFEDAQDAARAALIGFFHCMTSAVKDVKLGKYQIVLFPDKQDEEWVFYVAIFSEGEWGKFLAADCHKRIPTGFKHYLKKMMKNK